MTIHDEPDQRRLELERLELFNRLTAGLDEETARLLMAHIPSIYPSDIATKSDLAALEQKLRAEMNVGFTEVRGEMAELRGEVRELRGEVRGEIREVRGEMAELRGEMAELRGEMEKNTARSIRATIVAAFVVALPVVASLVTSLAQIYG